MKTNKFVASFVLPPAFASDPDYPSFLDLNQDAQLWCDSASLPGTTQQTMKVRRYGYGPLETVPITPIFDDVELRFISDASGDYWNMFHRWMNKTVNKDSTNGMWNSGDGTTGTPNATEIAAGGPLSPYETVYQNQYTSVFTVSVYNDVGDEVRRVVLNQAFPTAVSPVKTDWGDWGDVARFLLNVSYQDWTEWDLNV